jgi:hypothetical protein
VDNNILLKHPLGPYNNELGSLHQVAAHNLVLEGRLQHFNDASRMVPYYQPHSLRYVTKLEAVPANDKANQRYIDRNNIFIGQFSDQDGATDTAGNAKFDATAQQAMKFKHTDTPDGVTIEFVLSEDDLKRLTGGDLITSKSIGEFPLVKQRIEDRDGKPYDLDTDIAGQPRERRDGAAVPGPFAKLVKGKNAFRFTAGSTVSAFVSTNPEGK